MEPGSEKYSNYYTKLVLLEKDKIKEKFIGEFGKEVLKSSHLSNIINKLDVSFMLDLINKRLTYEQSVKAARVIENVLGDKKYKKITKVFDALNIDINLTLVAENSDGSIVAPSQMTRSVQFQAEKKNQNAVFPYPFGVMHHFPVLLCNPMFGDFLDILNEHSENSVVAECKVFMQDVEIASKMDKCLSRLIIAILDYNDAKNEDEFALAVISALKEVFPAKKGAVLVGTEQFPFVIIESRFNSYSMNSVLKGLQQYGIMNMDYIDNDPCFLMTVDKGIMCLYGMAKANRRIVCSCLLSHEFTSYAFNINDFRRNLYRTFSALAFFHKRISDRLLRKPNDEQHKKYSRLKTAYTLQDQPFPAIFNVDGVKFTFKNCKIKGKDETRQYFQPGVCMVKTEDGTDAVLKVNYSYGIEIHKAIHAAHPDLVPNVIAYQPHYDQYHLILMEYLDTSVYKSVFEYLNDPEMPIDRQILKQSLQGILDKLKGLGIVHGDFRAGNILAKRSEQDPTVLEDFKLIDFEFSGAVDTSYPFLAMKNVVIDWPADFNSYAPRKFAHDAHMMEQIFN